MAKIAVIFLLFALLAVAMSARIAREEPTTSPVLRAIDKVKEDLNSITSDFNKITSEQFRDLGKTYNDAVDGLLNRTMNLLKSQSRLQQVTLPPVHKEVDALPSN
ncbi:neuropeptide-like 2 isoform X1 [Drosophila elegans]|uniref:neuropeptide-like 2 isoform X1 n=1 Tax=Drosophila elegans TaxID=30023 RepID=UPI0007E79B9E|nr:neuropeptide-like 2 isoform X1 [Drosophila elegans]